MKRLSQLAITCVFLSACSSYQPQPDIHTPISNKPAVIDLLDKAKLDTNYGEYDQAKSKLERALRLDPQNPNVWLELAKVNKQQGKNNKAKNLALRAQSFTDDPRLEKIISRFLTTL